MRNSSLYAAREDLPFPERADRPRTGDELMANFEFVEAREKRVLAAVPVWNGGRHDDRRPEDLAVASRRADRLAEELRILRATRDGRLQRPHANGRWVIFAANDLRDTPEAPPQPAVRKYLVASDRITTGLWALESRITDKGRRMLVDAELCQKTNDQ